MDDLQEELPESQPRFVAYSYCYSHGDGRTSYPLCFFFVSPAGKNIMIHLHVNSMSGESKYVIGDSYTFHNMFHAYSRM